ncbi:tRNA-specific adenosine deaminase [Herbaspirillum sp. meg3]|uniref:nucleoside deaminase n=1 Tax=Herbaspirillum sp. meg3 TaxID=2025949 RepID=UPI000B9894DA|nr:nucleoside deaminase [Herbaspirillum sp. meg3]ASU40483.1 tRNA-specific adenosine deaminase [Herbaspirillum sp. meg3]
MTFNESDHKAMRLAIEASAEALADGDMPFGATLVSAQGEILLVAANNQNSAADCTGHAEMVLVRTAQKQLGLRALRGATVYASGEPCAMCSGAMFWAEIRRVVYAASTEQIGTALGGPQLPARSAEVLANTSPAMTVEGSLMADEACAVLAQFVPD